MDEGVGTRQPGPLVVERRQVHGGLLPWVHNPVGTATKPAVHYHYFGLWQC